MIGAGLVARKANALGLTRRPWVKTSFAPGSKVARLYLEEAGLLPELEKLGLVAALQARLAAVESEPLHANAAPLGAVLGELLGGGLGCRKVQHPALQEAPEKMFLGEIEEAEIEGVVQAEIAVTEPDRVVAEALPVDFAGPVGHQPDAVAGRFGFGGREGPCAEQGDQQQHAPNPGHSSPA